MARRPGFSLVELLVCLAVVTVLAALLFPIVRGARGAAMKVVCASRLRDLTLACNTHRIEKGAYPLQPGTKISQDAPPVGVSGGPVTLGLAPPKPTDMDPAFLNAIQPYLRFHRVDPNAGARALPPAVQCPTVEDADDAPRTRSAGLTMTQPALYTGYAYCVRPKNRTLAPDVKLLKPDRVASVKNPGRAVVWADDVQWAAPDCAWRFAHAAPRARPGPQALTFADSKDLLGQHVAYADGSVEWIDSSQIDLDIAEENAAASKASLSVFNLFFFWF